MNGKILALAALLATATGATPQPATTVDCGPGTIVIPPIPPIPPMPRMHIVIPKMDIDVPQIVVREYGDERTVRDVRGLNNGQLRTLLQGCLGCNFRAADLHGNDLRNLRIVGIGLRHANLAGADLSNSTLTGVDLSGANLSNARLHNTKFIGCDFSNTDLRNADMRDVELTGSDMSEASFK